MKIRGVQADFPDSLVDPVTGLKPRTEREVTALLWLRHQDQAVDWKRVRLYRYDLKDSGLRADAIFTPGSTLCYEYPLMSTNRHGGRVWGAMPADLLLLSRSRRPLAAIECKLAPHFTSGGTRRRTGQLARLARYLERALERVPGEMSTLLLVCPRCNCDRWQESPYAIALKNAIPLRKQGSSRVNGYLIFWEDIADALNAAELKVRRQRG